MSQDPYRQSPAPYGQGPYGGQPAPYGQSPYPGGPAPYGGAPAPTSLQATNTKAVVALCLGFSAPLVGLVFGILALREIQRTGEGGKGFAITGVVLGVLLLLVLVAYVGLIIAVLSSAMSGGAMSSDLFGSDDARAGHGRRCRCVGGRAGRLGPVETPGAARTVGILLFDGVEELDAVGPWEVLAWWTQRAPQDGWRTVLLSRDGAPVTAAKGMVLGAQASRGTCPPLDVLLHPGGRGTRRLAVDEEHLAWVRAQRASVPLLTSVCTGSLVYAAAGLLRGRPATTHRGALEELRALDPTVDVRPDARFVDDGDVVTSAGVSAGIDMALHLVARLAGVERAREVRRGIQYDPEPPV